MPQDQILDRQRVMQKSTAAVSSAGERLYRYAGLSISSDVALPELAYVLNGPPSDVRIVIQRDETSAFWMETLEVIETPPADSGRPYCFRSTDGRRYRLQYGMLADFIVERAGSSIRVIHKRGQSSIGAAQLRHLLLDHVLPRVLVLAGRTVVHAALVRVDGAGVAILGPSGAGKSTLAAALAHSGADLLSDDGFVLTAGETGIWATPTYPSLRLWPDSLRALYREPPQSEPMGETSLKRRVWAAAPAPGQQVPLAHVFIASKRGGPLLFTRLPPSLACMSLVANCFQLDILDQRALARTLDSVRGVAARVPVVAIETPKTYASLPDVCAAIIAACADQRPVHCASRRKT